MLHTGWQALAETEPETFLGGEPGLGVGGAEYLAGLGVVAVGADTWGIEVQPGESETVIFPVHQNLLSKHGVYLLENMNTASSPRTAPMNSCSYWDSRASSVRCRP